MLRTSLLAFFVVGFISPLHAEDWPLHRGNATRNGFTTDVLPKQLSLAWKHAATPPDSAWPRDNRMTFDRAHRVVVADGTVYFGSSADGKLYALDADTGKVKWMFYTEGPIRFAPAVWNDRIFVASDDGHLYCLKTDNGALIQKWQAGPTDQRVLGNNHLISRLPARGGPVIRDGIVYFAAGIWQSEGVHIHAINAKTGQTVWVNRDSGDIYMAQPHGGANAKSGVSAQGHLVVTDDFLLVPTGRAVPAVFDRRDGKFLYYHLQANTKRGGTPVMALDSIFLNGGMSFDLKTGSPMNSIGVGPVASYPKGFVQAVSNRLMAYSIVEKDSIDRKGKPIRVRTTELNWSAKEVAGGGALVVAGNFVVSAGGPVINTVDLNTHEVVWRAETKGNIFDLAIADGRLYASTDQGTIYCFADHTLGIRPKVNQKSESSPPTINNVAAAKAAKEILERIKITEGYCVDLGCGTGSLSLELAQRTNLRIYAVDDDLKNVAAARANLEAAGLYGTRVTVHHRKPAETRYPKYFANLIVSGRSVEGKISESARKEASRIQRPYGGVACFGKPGAMEISIRDGLAKSGSWTHQYSNAANTLCSADEIKGPLRVLWFRDIDLEMPSRHGRGHAPLFSEGRLFVEGLDALRGIDAYNGRVLWEFPLPGIQRAYNADHIVGTSGTGSNFCVSTKSVFVRTEDRCIRLDAGTGEKQATYEAPKQKNGNKGRWGYIAQHDGLLFGSLLNEKHIVRHAWRPADASMKELFTESQCLFAFDLKTGQLKWRYDAKHSIRNNALAIGDGRVFLIDRPLAANDRLDAAKRRGTASKPSTDPHPTGELICLNEKTGVRIWGNDKDIFGTMLAFSEKYDMLLMSYQSTRFKLPSEVGGRMAVFRATDGYRAWDKKVSYITRPLINDRTLVAQPAALDLLTGESQPFDIKSRSYGCGQLAGSKHLLLFRSATLGYVDLSRKAGVENFGGMRPGCWINALPVGNLVLIPDASAACNCSYQNRTWVALQGGE